MIATNNCGSDTLQQNVEVSTLPIANFESNVQSGCVPTSIAFTNLSSNNSTSFAWTFEGGNPSNSSQENPQVVYNQSGSFDVTLIVENPNGADTLTLQDYIVIEENPVAGFTSNIVDQTVTFTNTSTNANTYLWDFGDGSSSTLSNPTHTYVEDGIYLVNLIATGFCGSDTTTTEVEIATLPEADFSFDPLSGCEPLTVQFTDLSSSNVDSYAWTFEGGTPATSSSANPEVTYSNAGLFDVQLVVSNEQGNDTLLLEDAIEVLPSVEANFSFIINDLEVSFTQESQNADTYAWDFGDGNSSTLPNPSHTYAQDGIYTVELIAEGFCGSDTITVEIEIATLPQADFSFDPLSGCEPLIVQFTDLSSSNVDSYAWTFEGGTPATSTTSSPEVTYTNAGLFDVQLIVSNEQGNDTLILEDAIEVDPLAIADFSYIINGTDVSFTQEAQNADTYSWEFGDGNISTQPNPTHTYLLDGTYEVILEVGNGCGLDQDTQLVEIVTEPVAQINADTTSGCAVLEVQFDCPTYNAQTYEWTFEGGVPATSTLQNPSVEYPNGGVFDVQLIVSNPAGSDTLLLEQYIDALAQPISDWSFTSVNLNVDFISNAQFADTYFWDFGDGNTSTESDPSHLYSSSGVYTVSLIVENSCGVDTSTQVIGVNTFPIADFSADTTQGCIPFVVNFTDLSINANTWSWSFEGGNPSVSTDPNPSVSYDQVGIYDVQLIVSNDLGVDTLLLEDFVEVFDLPTAGFIFTTNELEVSFTNSSVDAVSYLWTMPSNVGPSTTYTETNPIHTFEEDGTYLVSLVATNACGEDTYTETVVVVSSPTANFESQPSEGCLPLMVSFTDLSSDNVDTYQWTFEGGDPQISTDPNPQVMYTQVGTFGVELIVTNAAGSDTLSLEDVVVVNDVPTVDFTYTSNLGEVVFTNLSLGAQSYSWNFGDGNSSVEENPTHVYAVGGTYIVELTAENNCGVVTIEEEIEIVLPPEAEIGPTLVDPCAPTQVQFEDASSDNVTTWLWTFEGGTPQSSTDQNPLISYAQGGSYDVTLVVSNAAGSDTVILADYIVLDETPSVDYTYTVQGFEVSFVPNASNYEGLLWNFGDGNTSTEESPTHQFAVDGVYEVVLQAINSCGISETIQEVVIAVGLPEANFSSSLASGCAPLEVDFENASSANTASIEWFFQGQGGSVDDNPQITYNQTGNYDVMLIASNPNGSDTMMLEDYVQILPEPEASFDYTLNNFTVNFQDQSTGAGNYLWDFGDGNTSTLSNPSHTYATDGTYLVTLTVVNACGQSTFSSEVSVVIEFPQASFSVENNEGCAPLVVQFFDTSSGSVDSRNWVFEGGDPQTSTLQNPIVTYSEPGSYDVKLEVGNSAGTNNVTAVGIVTVLGEPTADFSYTINSDGSISFINTSQDADTYLWDFGDGVTTTTTSPIYTYEELGTYLVTLQASNACGTVETVLEIDIISSLDIFLTNGDLLIYPNPSSGLFFMEWRGAIDYFKPFSWSLWTITGQVIEKGQVLNPNTSLESIDIDDQPDGVYMLRLENEEGSTFIRLIKD